MPMQNKTHLTAHKNFPSVLFLPLILLLAGCSFGEFQTNEEEEAMPVYVFAGQSNMLGKRSRADELPEDLRSGNSRALFFHERSNTWIPLTPGTTQPKGFGPEIAFAESIADLHEGEFGIIKVSRGGTNLYRQWNPDNPDSLFQRLARLVATARQTRPIKVIGMIWIQGGADARKQHMANAYADNLRLLVERSREAFGNPDMHFVSSRIPPKNNRRKPHWPTVRAAQENLQITNFSWANSDDISTGPDGVHFDTLGMVKLGERLAQIMRDNVALSAPAPN